MQMKWMSIRRGLWPKGWLKVCRLPSSFGMSDRKTRVSRASRGNQKSFATRSDNGSFASLVLFAGVPSTGFEVRISRPTTGGQIEPNSVGNFGRWVPRCEVSLGVSERRTRTSRGARGNLRSVATLQLSLVCQGLGPRCDGQDSKPAGETPKQLWQRWQLGALRPSFARSVQGEVRVIEDKLG